MDGRERSAPRETSLQRVRVEVDDLYWATLTPITELNEPGCMVIDLVLHFPSHGDEDLIDRLHALVSDEYSKLAWRAACGHWTLLNHVLPDHLF